MKGSRRNFEQALANLEKLKEISRATSDSSYLDSPARLDQRKQTCSSVMAMKEALKNVENYLLEVSCVSKNHADKVLKESDFLIAGVQNVFSFLENQEDIYKSLLEEYSEVNRAYDEVKKNFKQPQTYHLSTAEETQEHKEPECFLNNLVEVKRDRSYELFYMLDEQDKRFYNDALVQIIYKQNKLYETVNEGDPLTKTLLWNSEEVKNIASLLVLINDVPLRLFYQSALSHLDIAAVVKVHNAVMALFFSRYEATMVAKSPKKHNILYFNDFLLFLREAWKDLNNDIAIDSQEKKQAKLLALALSIGIFESKLVFEEASRYLYFNIQTKLTNADGKKPLSSGQYLTDAYDELHRLISKYPNGPIFKAMDRVLEHESKVYDPMILGILPSLEGRLKLHEKSIDVIRSPSPVIQSSISYANCNEEFLGFLSAKVHRSDVTLVLNIQNRISRKERARSRVIEEALEQEEYASSVDTFSFPEPEELLDNLESIHGDIETFSDFFFLLQEEFRKPLPTSSFFLTKELKEPVHTFLKENLTALKDIFFPKKKILFRNDKLLLLHLLSYLLVFKLIETINPNSIVVLSKDGLDYASVFIAGFAFFSREAFWDEHSLKLLLTAVLSPTFVARDRLVFVSHIELLSKFVNCLKKNRQGFSSMKSFFKGDIESWEFTGYMHELTEVSHKHNS
ncbi:calcium-binding protein [Candidatus Chlamydia corallus]|uniref:calcium-binding protein n=1 Tax=Candidatus Chlamydia corallus TaxID=2038470 RepID=UPI000C2FEA97|nr:calcium-binding protein [Candidatus Chlamydia corallus]